MGHGVDIVDHFVHAVEDQDWHNGAEDLFLHHGVGKGYIVENGRLNAERMPVRISAMYGLVFINKS